MQSWAYQGRVKLDFIRRGKPVENGYIESVADPKAARTIASPERKLFHDLFLPSASGLHRCEALSGSKAADQHSWQTAGQSLIRKAMSQMCRRLIV